MRRSPHALEAFTLIELLMVIFIISVLAVLAFPGFRDMTLGSNVERAGATVEDNFKLAQMRAVSKNRMIEIRLYKYSDPETVSGEGFRALQMFEKKPDETYLAVTRVIPLPEPMVMIEDPAYSSLLANDETNEGTDKPSLPRIGTAYSYRRFGFSPNGGTTFRDKTNLYYVTMAEAKRFPPQNFYTVQVDPVNAKVTAYRP
jgi:uncharacterized protein (TIGR02596 family)